MEALETALAQAAAQDPAVLVVEGREAAVTSALALAARALSDEGPLVVVPNNNYRVSFLAAASGAGTEDVETLTAVELCERVLGTCGEPVPRVMLPFEEDLVIEDLKVTGLKPRRVQEMTRFFVRGLSELSDRDPAWLVSDEERQMFALLDNHLASRHVVYADQLAGLALAALDGPGQAPATGADLAGRTVIVDGYTALDRAIQELIGALAPGLLVAGGRDDDCGVPQFPYFDASGLSRLREGGARVFHAEDGRPLRASVVRTAGPSAETRRCVRGVESWLAEGADPSRVLVEAPSCGRIAELSDALSRAGIPSEVVGSLHLGRATDASAPESALGAFAVLGLAADPLDANAWRTWLSLGQWLGNSAAWSVLRKLSATSGLPLEGVIERLSPDEPPESLDQGEAALLERLAGPLARGREASRELEGAVGAGLEAGIARFTSPEAAASLSIRAGENAAATYARVRRELFDPEPPRGGGVLLSLPADAVGISADMVCHVGAVEGVLPELDACDPMTPPVRRERLLREDRRAFGAAVQHGAERVVFTWPQDMELEEASRAKVHIERIHVDGGRRMARLSRSRFLDEMFQNAERG